MLIDKIAHNAAGGVSTVSALVDGVPLWFNSKDVSLSPSPEALDSALLIPSMAKNESLNMTL